MDKTHVRHKWLDLAKALAMLIVTWDHASQTISGITFNDLLGGGELAAFHMPLFFILSGYVINLNTLYDSSFFDTAKQKGLRLLIPALAWALLRCIFTLKLIMPWVLVSIYWYLTDLFVSYIILALSVKICKGNQMLTFGLSMLFVFLCPRAPVFMMPFLWVGMIMKKYNHLIFNKYLFLVSLLIASYIYTFWDWSYTIYLAHYDVLNISIEMLRVYAIRFVMGCVCSYVLIFICFKLNNTSIADRYSYLGKYTLTVYLFSLFLHAIISRWFALNFTQPFIFEIMSFAAAVLVYGCSICLYRLFKKNKYTTLYLLGE